jgi:hypothetical protein
VRGSLGSGALSCHSLTRSGTVDLAHLASPSASARSADQCGARLSWRRCSWLRLASSATTSAGCGRYSTGLDELRWPARVGVLIVNTNRGRPEPLLPAQLAEAPFPAQLAEAPSHGGVTGRPRVHVSPAAGARPGDVARPFPVAPLEGEDGSGVGAPPSSSTGRTGTSTSEVHRQSGPLPLEVGELGSFRSRTATVTMAAAATAVPAAATPAHRRARLREVETIRDDPPAGASGTGVCSMCWVTRATTMPPSRVRRDWRWGRGRARGARDLPAGVTAR